MSTYRTQHSSSEDCHEQHNSGSQPTIQKVGNVQFAWRMVAHVTPIDGQLLRIQLAVQPEGTSGEPFLSNPVTVVLGELATAVFPHTSGSIANDDFTIERFEAQPRHSGERGAIVQFRILPDSTGTEAHTVVIEKTSIAIFWLIGVRNITLTDVGDVVKP